MSKGMPVPDKIETIAVDGGDAEFFDAEYARVVAALRAKGKRIVGVRFDSQMIQGDDEVVFIAIVMYCDSQPKPENTDAQDRDPA